MKIDRTYINDLIGGREIPNMFLPVIHKLTQADAEELYEKYAVNSRDCEVLELFDEIKCGISRQQNQFPEWIVNSLKILHEIMRYIEKDILIQLGVLLLYEIQMEQNT